VTARQCLVATALALAVAGPGGAHALPPGADPDWPCQQIKVPTLSAASMWAAPGLPEHADWRSDAEVSALVRRLAERRVPLQQATAEVVDFAGHAGPQKRARLVALFLGLLDTINTERDSVLAGLDRFGRRQRELAESLRADAGQLSQAQTTPAPDQKRIDGMAERVSWENRVFQQRRQALSFVCDVPGQIEQRLFALARVIQQRMQ